MPLCLSLGFCCCCVSLLFSWSDVVYDTTCRSARVLVVSSVETALLVGVLVTLAVWSARVRPAAVPEFQLCLGCVSSLCWAHFLEDRDHKGGRLAGAVLGTRQNVAAGERNRYALLLNR